MKLPQPRVIAIDNEANHLQPLVDALNKYGAACRPILFGGSITQISPAPHARVIFTDLHLESGATSAQKSNHFSIIQSILERLAPEGPYVLILWTRYQEDSQELETYLRDRMRDLRTPFAIVPLDKTTHMPTPDTFGEVSNIVDAIDGLFDEKPHVAALLDWEDRVNAASADTITGILGVSASEEGPDVSRVLLDLAEGIVGGQNTEGQVGRSVAEALLPVLFDRLTQGSEPTEALWAAAIATARAKNGDDKEGHARLNAFTHLDTNGSDCSARGAVITLPEIIQGRFSDHFGNLDANTLAEQFGVKPDEQPFDDWLLVQVRPACDEAQPKPGPLPYLLAREFTPDCRAKALGGLWRSPTYIRNNAKGIRALAVNSRFAINLPDDRLVGAEVRFRLRNELLFELIHSAGSHTSRPGIVSYGKR